MVNRIFLSPSDMKEFVGGLSLRHSLSCLLTVSPVSPLIFFSFEILIPNSSEIEL